jgi:hypothetical protein
MDPVSDAPVVVLEYADAFKIELAPAFVDMTGNHPRRGGPACYLACVNGDWKPADYDYDAKVITDANGARSANGMIVPGIKMSKAYLRSIDVPLKGFHVEVLFARTIPARLADWATKYSSWDYSHVLAQFLEDAAELVTKPVALSGSFSPPIDSGLSPAALFDVADRLRDRARQAWRLCKSKDDREALLGWRKFFGDPFPAIS